VGLKIFCNVGQLCGSKERVVTLGGQGLPLRRCAFRAIVHGEAVVPGSSGREADEPFTTLKVPSN